MMYRVYIRDGVLFITELQIHKLHHCHSASMRGCNGNFLENNWHTLLDGNCGVRRDDTFSSSNRESFLTLQVGTYCYFTYLVAQYTFLSMSA